MAKTAAAHPPYVTALLEAVRERTGTDVSLKSQGRFTTFLSLHYGKRGCAHRVHYYESLRDHESHIAMNAALKILRFWDAVSEDRVIAIANPSGRLPPQMERDLVRNTCSTPELAREISVTLFDGAVQQLVGMAADVRMERDIFQDCPEHRLRQQLYWNRVLLDTTNRVLPIVYAYPPRQLSDAIVALHATYARQASELGGFELPLSFTNIPCRTLAMNLQEHLRGIETLGYKGDCLLTDAWGVELGMRDWYLWHGRGSKALKKSEHKVTTQKSPMTAEPKLAAIEPRNDRFSEWLF